MHDNTISIIKNYNLINNSNLTEVKITNINKRRYYVMSKELKKWVPYVFGFSFIAGIVVAGIYYLFVK